MRIGLLGDTHGDFGWIKKALNLFAEEGIFTILQVGDLGVWPGEHHARGWKKINDLLIENRQYIYAVPGNHEDYDQIEKIAANMFDGFQYLTSNIALIPRGHRWEWDGVTFVGLGGAASVDRSWRTVEGPRQTWWSQEAITDEDVQNVISGGYADVMVCHDAPEGVHRIERMISGNPHGFKQVDIAYANEIRAKMTEVVDAIQPRILLHGHYHFAVQEARGDTFIFGLDKNNSSHALGEFSTLAPYPQMWTTNQTPYTLERVTT